jgi:hypothetical protein
LLGGVAVVVATRDQQLRPAITRGWGRDAPGEGAALTLCVSAAPGSQTLSNLEDNGAVAVTFSLPTSYRTVQVKGAVVDLCAPTADHLARVEEHVAAFVDEVERVGVPRALARRFVGPDLVAVCVAVRELYDQTPGPNAGRRL